MNAPELKCPNCGYDLHGLETDPDGIFRCPECGGLTNIMAIVDEHARRARQDRRIFSAILIVIGVLCVVMLLSSALPRSWFNLTSTFIVFFMICFAMLAFCWRRTSDFSWPLILIFSTICSLFLALPQAVPFPMACGLYPLALAVFFGLAIWVAAHERS